MEILGQTRGSEVLHRGLWRLSAHALAVCVAGIGCAEDTTQIPEELRGDPYCMLIVGTYGHLEDGSNELILDYEREIVAAGCVCSNPENIESGERDEELNEAAFAVCQDQAAARGFVSDECREHYESGQWTGSISRCDAGSDCAQVPSPDLGCIGS